MRLVLVNPHVNQAGNMVYNWLFRFPQHHKYAYLWREGILKGEGTIGFLVDGRQSSFYQTDFFRKTIGRSTILVKLFSLLEFWIWMSINDVPRKKVKIFLRPKSLDPRNDILFTFGFTNHGSKLQSFHGFTFVHMSHYHLETEAISGFIRSLQHPICIAEGDLSTNPYFQHFFPQVSRVYQLPFTYQPSRFKNERPFDQRTMKCFASGPSSVPTSSSYVKFFGKGTSLNPMREQIYQHKEKLSSVIDAYIFPHRDALQELKHILPSDPVWKRAMKNIFPVWVLKMIFSYQLPYFRFDIVEKYNEYAMFASPEERTGLPSMKMFEGMLCGSVLVAIDHPMYTNLGFKDGENYIAYRENDVEDLVRKISYYQQHPDQLREISRCGDEFARSRFDPRSVFQTFWKDCERIVNHVRNEKDAWDCSFVNPIMRDDER